ncbi:MAG: hypothetical protein E7578_00830 [Ruminococcaceae bacterium]|nr:hypothetical protein [Oscillospiraceae bacterium]
MNNDKNFGSHSIFIHDRHSAELTGIDDVFSFDDCSVSAHSALGDLIVDGDELRIDNFSSEKGILTISGRIIGIYYIDDNAKKRSSKRRSTK